MDQGNSSTLAGGNIESNLEAIAQNLGQFPTSQPSEALSALQEEAQHRLGEMQRLQLQQEELWRNAKDQQADLLKEVQEAKEAGLRRLREQETAAGKLLAALGAEGTSSGYRTTAGDEEKQASFWRWIAMGAGVVGAALAVTLFVWWQGQGIEDLAARFGVTVPVLLLAVYAGSQSAGHRNQEREARRLELAFGSVDAYLADLDSVKRAELKGMLTSGLFRSEHGDSVNAEGYPTVADLSGS